MNRFIIPLLGFVVLLGFLGAGLTLMPPSGAPRTLPSPLLGKPAPAFTLPRLLEPQQSFSSQAMRGRVWLLNVWASWCVACRAEHALLNQLAQSGETPIIGLNYKDNAEDAAAWLRQLGNPYARIAFDRRGDVGIEYGVYGVPETYLIDKSGVIRFKHIGPLSADALRQSLLPLIAQLHRGN